MQNTTPIARLRGAAADLRAAGSDDAAWLADGIARYEEQAPDGITLDATLGLSRGAGAGPWWIREARARRDKAARELHQAAFANLGLSAAATEIARTVRRRATSEGPPACRRDVLADQVLRSGQPLPTTKKQLLAILRGK